MYQAKLPLELLCSIVPGSSQVGTVVAAPTNLIGVGFPSVLPQARLGDMLPYYPATLKVAMMAGIPDESIPKRLVTCVLACLRAKGMSWLVMLFKMFFFSEKNVFFLFFIFFLNLLKMIVYICQSWCSSTRNVYLQSDMSSFLPCYMDKLYKILQYSKFNQTNSFLLSETWKRNLHTLFDTYPIKVLKSLSDILSPVICNIINDSFETGYFPNFCKIAKVIPLFKSGEKTDVQNYRPISILSKIIEKVVHHQLAIWLPSKELYPFP